MLKYFKDKRIGKTKRLVRIFKRYKDDWGSIKSNYLSFLEKEDAIKLKYKLVFINFESNRVKDWRIDFENQIIDNIFTNSETLLKWFEPGTLSSSNN